MRSGMHTVLQIDKKDVWNLESTNFNDYVLKDEVFICKNWAVARTLLLKENKVQSSLHDVGVETYVPRYFSKYSFKGRVVTKARELFPGYVLFAINSKWKSVFQIDEIISILMSGEYPAPVRQSVIDELRSRESNDGLIYLPDKIDPKRIRNGQRVMVKQGAFFGLYGTFKKYIGGDRIIVLFNILGKDREIIMRSDVVESSDVYAFNRSRHGRRKRYRGGKESRTTYPSQLSAY
jgi:Transcription antiterminator